MLLSFSKHFLFIANTKAASTTIERMLKRHADISINSTRLGKHMSYSQILKNFQFVFRKSGADAEEYFRFGVIREPLEWVISWYNYRHREEALSTPLKAERSTHGVSFDKFAFEVMNPAQRSKYAHIGNQLTKFTDMDGALGVDYLIPLGRIDVELPRIAEELGIKKAFPPQKRRSNVSPKIISAVDVPPSLAEQLRSYFAEDMALFQKAQHGGFGDLRDIIRQKAGAGVSTAD